MTDHTHHLFVVGGVGVAQWPVGAAEVGQVEGVLAVDADVVGDGLPERGRGASNAESAARVSNRT